MKVITLRLVNLPSMHEAFYFRYRKQLKRFEMDMHKPCPNTLSADGRSCCRSFF